jgi:O-acetyl-ADP-ribose deacetylase (regulator of RNase III)
LITVRRGSLVDSECEAIIRPVRADLGAVTQAGRELEIAAGPLLAQRLEGIGDTPLGGAVITPAGEHQAGFHIHVVVEAPEESSTLASLERGLMNGLRRAEELAIESLSLPPLGAGVGGFDLDEVATLMLRVLKTQLDHSETLSEIEIVVSTEAEETAFLQHS